MRGIGAIAKMAPRISKGIGQATAITRKIGDGARQVRTIGQAVNQATGNKLQDNKLFRKAMDVTNKVESGAAKAEGYAPRIQEGVNRAQALASQYS